MREVPTPHHLFPALGQQKCLAMLKEESFHSFCQKLKLFLFFSAWDMLPLVVRAPNAMSIKMLLEILASHTQANFSIFEKPFLFTFKRAKQKVSGCQSENA